jgi:hypothetical protein
MEHRYRIMLTANYSGSDSDGDWTYEVNNILWSGEDLPTKPEQEVLIVSAISSVEPVPFDVAPNVSVEPQIILQELYIKKVREVGRYANIVAWPEYEPSEEDEDTYYVSMQ